MIPADHPPGSARVGVLGRSPWLVDGTGAVLDAWGGPVVGWAVATDERWRFPATEAAVRQQQVQGLPVVETALRVVGGDVVARTWALPASPAGAVVCLELHDDSPAPVAVAFVVRGRALRVDGLLVLDGPRPVARLGRAPAGIVGVTDPVDLPAALAGATIPGGPAGGPADPADADPWGAVALVFPVAHRTRVRCAVLVDDAPVAQAAQVDVASAPGFEAVVDGWRRVLDRATRVGLPDARANTAIDADRIRLLLPADDAERLLPLRIRALAAWGHGAEAREAIRSYELLRLRRAGFPIGEGTAVPPAEFLVALAEVQVLAAEEGPVLVPAAERSARRAEGRRRPPPAAEPPPPGVVATAGVAARLVEAHRRLVRATAATVELLPVFDPAWLGQPVDVADLPTPHGVCSFAVRWHGERPALLWDRVDGADGVVVQVPGLDPAWGSDERRGEALLAPPAAGPSGP